MKEVKIKLDDKTIEILSDIDPIHRESIINFGVRLASQTEYFRILKGEENVEVLNEISTETKSDTKQVEEKAEEPKSGIDLSDLGF